ncbi:Fungal specific transcription factor [Colletotrichum higginsianum IMI 349063]|uniref:Fungal specific transcription factor n=1 Tax=Colletotrichum higginsianum (strain IMI 349063) TaxID=759273 RepID=A0A1B7YT31_COLHI|nr:Fungal specific transcription factor [Colletotrichum higginsianum IMI 349063]OBR15209.1 Fungal specific transcription factor [Colletotrichum higginsianum IMI 349063]
MICELKTRQREGEARLSMWEEDATITLIGNVGASDVGVIAPERIAASSGLDGAPPTFTAHDDNDDNDDNDNDGGGGGGGGEWQGQGLHGHHQQHSPGTPISAHGGGSSGETPHHDAFHGGNLDDPKRPRACEACRGLKVRCEPDANDPDGPCKRCKKAGRNCVVTMPTRKRQKKTDSRVAELEKKIDALTASLQARGNSATPSTAAAGAASVAMSASATKDENLQKQRGWGDNGMSRNWNTVAIAETPGSPADGLGLDSQELNSSDRGRYDTMIPPAAGQKRKFADRGDTPADMTESGNGGRPAPPIHMGSDYADVVERGILSAEKAAELFERYNTHMMPHMPAVVFAAGTTAEETRRFKPLLFLAIMSAASSESPNVQRRLVKELMQIFAEKIIITGEKSLEIVQALQVAVIWYWPPEHFEELKFYQLVHIGAVMALDIGLGRRTAGRKMQIPYQWRNHPFRRAPPPDPSSIECRRAWLAAYFLAANTSMALHRPNLVRWTSFMAESMEVLQTSADAAPTDKYFCHLVWTHRLAEEVGIQFSMDDPAVVPNITDSRTQYSLRMLERDLEKYTASVPKEEMQSTLRMSFHIALHTKTDDIRPPFDTATLKDGMLTSLTLTTSHINALSACLSAIDGIFDAFLAMEVPSIRCLPVFNFVRIAYAVVVLIKMYFSATAPGSELGKVIDKDNMKVESYLDALLEKFRAAASDDRSRPAAKFMVVLVMLRSWFLKQSKGLATGGPPGSGGQSAFGSAATPGVAMPTSTSQVEQTPASTHTSRPIERTPMEDQQRAFQPGPPPPRMREYPAANTPLHLLSEIATNDHSGRVTNNMLWNPPPSSARQSFLYDPSAVTPTPLGGSRAGPGTASSGTVDHPSVSSNTNTGSAAAPWTNSAWAGDLQDMGFDVGFTEGLSLEEITTGFGASPDSLSNGMRYVMAQDPWLSGIGGFENLFEGMPGASGPPMFPM